MQATLASRIIPSGSVRDESLEYGFSRRRATAYETAYDRFGARMYTAALRLLRDREMAEECVHDVFLHLWRRPGAYEPSRGSLEAFLVTCARNQALTQLRNASRRRDIAANLETDTEYSLDEDPIERDRIERAVSQLSDGQAAVIQFAYYRGMTLSEVASELDLPVGTVKGRLSAALRALRRSLIPETVNGT